MEDAVRWSVKVSKSTDLTLRMFLQSKGMKRGERSKFVEDAVRWRMFDQTVQQVKARNADTGPDELQVVIDEAVEMRDCVP